MKKRIKCKKATERPLNRHRNGKNKQVNNLNKKKMYKSYFLTKTQKEKHPELLFNKTPAAHSSSQKHFRIVLDEKLSFANHNKVKKL